MSEHDAIRERGRSIEEEYFRRKDHELIERMRQAARDEVARREMGTATGIADQALLAELQALGFTPETVSLLPLVPLVQVAWVDASMSAAERSTVVTLARVRGIAEGSAADRMLSDWLGAPPDPQLFAGATRLIRAMLDAPEHDPSSLTADDLVEYCERIASASGGVFGMGRITADERSLLKTIASDLKTRA